MSESTTYTRIQAGGDVRRMNHFCSAIVVVQICLIHHRGIFSSRLLGTPGAGRTSLMFRNFIWVADVPVQRVIFLQVTPDEEVRICEWHFTPNPHFDGAFGGETFKHMS
jgi:hypothetical protein